MKVPKEYYDEIFEFKGQWDMPSSCGLKIRTVDGVTYVLAVELYQDNPGTSVTYAGRSLAEQICEAKGLDIDKITFVECNPDTNSKLSFYGEMCFAVDFDADPAHKYTQLSSEQAKRIISAQ